MPTPDQCEATYHGGIGSLLTAAYRRDFSMQEQGRCKRKFLTFDEWYATLNAEQRLRVDKVLIAGVVGAGEELGRPPPSYMQFPHLAEEDT